MDNSFVSSSFSNEAARTKKIGLDRSKNDKRKIQSIKNIIKLIKINKIAGVDEVGRGCLAGPVFAAAVILNKNNTKGLLLKGYLEDDFWFHDQDSWQVNKVNFPEFEGEIGGCTYVYTPEWNTCSMFIKHTSKHVVKYVVVFLELKKVCLS